VPHNGNSESGNQTPASEAIPHSNGLNACTNHLPYNFAFFEAQYLYTGNGGIEGITVPGCSTGSGMIFVELRGTRILTEGDFRFYTQPEVGRWVASSKCASGFFRVC
jgi:hypothetical protein